MPGILLTNSVQTDKTAFVHQYIIYNTLHTNEKDAILRQVKSYASF